MDKSQKNILLWAFIYWVACVNTTIAIGFTLLTNSYDYGYSISATKLALICATLQFVVYKYQGKIPFYKQFGLIFLSTLIYLAFFEINSSVLFNGIETLGMFFLLVFGLTLPLVLVSYFVRFRVYKYSKNLTSR